MLDPSDAATYALGFSHAPVMSKPVGTLAEHGGEPATNDGCNDSSAPKFNAVSPFAGAVADGPPMLSEPVVVVPDAAAWSTAVVALVTDAM